MTPRTTADALHDAVQALLPEATDLLSRLVAQPTLPGREQPGMDVMEAALKSLGGQVERVPMDNALRDDPHYSDPIPGIDYTGRHNLRYRTGDGPARLIINGHMDVVPPSPGQDDAFNPRVQDGVLYGRGASDDKGPVVSAWLALAALRKAGLAPAGPVSLHVVCEEENGGNGTLAMARDGESAQACITLESTSLHPATSVRGAVWFRIRFTAEASHSGAPTGRRSALALAREAMTAIEAYHADLRESSKGIALFDRFESPMPLTFGRLDAGNWPAAAPSNALLEGVIGFLPNRTAAQVCKEMERALTRALGSDAGQMTFETTYRHDCCVVHPAHWLPQAIIHAGNAMDLALEPCAFPASCDAWFYKSLCDIPTLVFGPGTLRHAHSIHEQIDLAELGRAAEILARVMLDPAGA